MKKHLVLFTGIILTFNSFIYTQEALKSTEEEYYAFLSLTGVVERPTLGYRTLSDSVWNFKEVESFEENEDGTFTKVRIPGSESKSNIWKNNNLGTTYTLWQPATSAENWFARGLKQGLFARIYGPEWFNSYNTTAPYGQNDGALWQGRGYNTSLTTGLRLEGYGFELTFKPQVSWSQNKEFEINRDIYPNPYSYTFQSGTVYHPIDLVQRYGDKSFWNFDWGDTEIRWSWRSLTFGFGTQNPWLGPAYLNPMLGSNNAPGYLKLDAGLRKTEIILPFLNWSLGFIEGRIWVGQLKESQYFDNNDENNNRMIVGMEASYEPSFIPGLSIGINRIIYNRWRYDNIIYITRLFARKDINGTGSGNDEDQKISMFINWVFPKIGFSVYGEYGFDDLSNNMKTNPFHTAIYTIGAKQVIPLPFNLKSELLFEWNNFEMSQNFQLQWQYMGYYAHGALLQGYTHKGQVLGAGTGYFGNSQMLKYIVYHKHGFITFNFHRFSNNNNSVYNQAVNTASDQSSPDENSIYHTWYNNFETFFCYGIEANYFVTNNTNISCSLTRINIYNQNYLKQNNNYSFNITLSLDYNF